MAKKARKKRVVRKKVAKPKKAKQTSFVSKRHPTPLTAVHMLGIAGGIITLIAGILWILGTFLSWSIQAYSLFNFGDLGIINMICGLIILIAGATLKRNFLRAGLILLIFSLIALIAPPGGFLVGPILGMVGAFLALSKSPR